MYHLRIADNESFVPNPSKRKNLISFRWLSIAAIVFLVVSCATPSERFDEQALHFKFRREVVKGVQYDHVTYRNSAMDNAAVGDLLHVYLDGDGLPWLRRTVVAADPTPRHALMLELMVLDKAPSLYLGRPCYHGFAQAPRCSAELWTNRRYSPEVVESMAGALATIVARTHYAGLVFIGYSGGGTLAMLLAERFRQTKAVLTIVANLDPLAWTSHHGYSPLQGSLNPANRPPLPSQIKQLHFIGGQDDNIPGGLILPVIKSQPGATFFVFDTFDHSCCWRAAWPAMLVQLCRLIGEQECD